MTNAFLRATTKKNIVTENFAISNSSTGKHLVDQFGKAGAYRGRDLAIVWAEQSLIWGENPLDSVKFVGYLRLITRKSKGFIVTDKVQNGQGARDEAFKRLLWIAKYHPETFYKNLWLIPVVGSWKDIFTLMALDIELKTQALDRAQMFDILMMGINDEDYNKALVQKYLPQIRANSKCKTVRAKTLNGLAKGVANYFGWTDKEYRQFKSNGKAHTFQRLIAAKMYDKLVWNEIPGKALFNLIKGKFLEKHNLEASYLKWLESQPVAKFTGYVYELGNQVIEGSSEKIKNLSLVKKTTFDKQFKGLIELAKKNEGGIKGNVWCALDTSGSMTSEAVDGTTAYNVCISLGVYFAELNEGAFHNHVIMFDATSRVLKLTGDSFVDRIKQITSANTAWGNTNFQSVIDEIVRIRKANPRIPISNYPETLLVVSDLQFDIATAGNKKTNYEKAMQKLAAVGLPEMKIIWWRCTGRYGTDFPSTLDDKGTYFLSGFDGSIITMICGGEKIEDKITGIMREKTMEEKLNKALNQEVLAQIVL